MGDIISQQDNTFNRNSKNSLGKVHIYKLNFSGIHSIKPLVNTLLYFPCCKSDYFSKIRIQNIKPMKSRFFSTLILFSLAFTTLSLGQNTPTYTHSNIEQPGVISVSGTAELEVIPDEIYIAIELKSYLESKKKIDLAELESQLRTKLSEQGINQENLYLSDAKSNPIYSKRLSGVRSQHYSLKVSTAKETEKVFNVLHSLKIKNAYISKTSHSNIISLRKKARVQAIKAAKDKAIYLLEAIGESCGKPLDIQEESLFIPTIPANPLMYKSNYLNSTDDKISSDIQFDKIKISSTFHVKFHIE